MGYAVDCKIWAAAMQGIDIHNTVALLGDSSCILGVLFTIYSNQTIPVEVQLYT